MAPEIPARPYKTCGPHQDCQFEVQCGPRQRSWDEWAQPTTRRSRPFAPRTSRPTSKATAFAVFSWREMVDFQAPNCQAAAGRELASIRENSLPFAKKTKNWALAPMFLYALSSLGNGVARLR